MMDARYALYFVPEAETALADFGWNWLGRAPADPIYRPISAARSLLVGTPRLYGFHATLKAPFRLAPGLGEDELTAELAAFAAARASFVEPPFSLAALDGFVALRPSVPSAAIQLLAGDCVRAFDHYRAPPRPEDLAKRLAAPLSERQRALLDRWGYPYVFDEYRLHLTLTGSLSAAERDAAMATIGPLAAGALAEPVSFRSLCLFRQPAAGEPFVLAERFPFRG